MKKSLLIAALVLSVVAANARDYKHSLGVNVGSLYGITYKGYVGDNDYDGDVDNDDWEDEWDNYLNDKMDAYDGGYGY